MKPEYFTFFREHKYAEVGRSVAPTRLEAKEVRTLLYASVKNPDRAMTRLMNGTRVRTIYGTYWAVEKPVKCKDCRDTKVVEQGEHDDIKQVPCHCV